MNDSVTGRAIGADTKDAQVAYGNAYLAAHPITPTHKFFTTEELNEIMLGMAEIAGNAVITHCPGWDQVTSAPNTGDGLDRPPPALAQQVNGSGVFVTLWLKTGAGTTDWTAIAGVGVDLQLSTKIPLPDGVGSAGAYWGTKAAAEDHVHPEKDPLSSGAFLYPAYIRDSYLRDSVRALSFAEGGATYGLTLDYGWTQIDGISTWKKDSSVPIKAFVDGVGGDFDFDVGDRFYVLNEGGLSSQAKYNGIYEVLQQSTGAGTYAIVRRVADANTPETLCSGMVVNITGAGVAYSGYWLQITTADPIVVDTTAISVDKLVSYTSQSSLNALTDAQIVTAGATADEYSSYTSGLVAAAGLVDFFWTPTLSGTPGTGSIPAGRFTVTARLAYATGGDSGATSVLKACFGMVDDDWDYGTDGLPTPFLTATSPPLTETPTTVTFQADLAAPVTTEPTKRILWWWAAETTSTTSVTVGFVFQEATRTTRVQTTLTFSVMGGTNSHPDLLNRDAADQHPWSALEPKGLAVHPYASASIDVSGKLDLGASNIYAVTAGGNPLKMIQVPSGIDANETTWIKLLFLDAVVMQHAQTPAGGYASLYLREPSTSPGGPNIGFKNVKSTATFLLIGGEWVLDSYHAK